MNCTLMGLILSTFYSASPFLSTPHAKQLSSNLLISNVQFSYHFSNFLFSPSFINQQKYAIIKKSCFSNFLDRVIFIANQNKYVSSIKTDMHFTERLIFSEMNGDALSFDKILLSQTIIIDRCNFNYINSKNEEGGCIYTTAHLSIKESAFESCNSKSGCIYCENSYLSLFSTVFESCISQSMSSCFVLLYNKTKQDIPTVISFNSFSNSQSRNLFGISYIKSVNPVSITYSNITKCGASQCVGSFEIAKSAIYIRFSKFFRSYANVHNGCIVIREASQFLIESSAFIQCQQKTTLTETGCDLLIYNIPAESTIKNTAFIDSRFSNGFSITIVNGIELSFEECIFSFQKNSEINPSSMYLCVFSNTIFECSNSESNQNEDQKMIEEPEITEKCMKINSDINQKIILSDQTKAKTKKQLQKNKYDDKYLSILFSYDSRIDIAISNSSSFISNLASSIAEKNFCQQHGIRKKHIIFFFLYVVFLVIGFIMVFLFELLNRKYPSLCVIKPNKGGFMLAKTPHAIL